MLVSNVINNRGNAVRNQLVITKSDGTMIFQSYKSEVLIFDYNNRILTFGENWDYSQTTGKYRNQILEDVFKVPFTKAKCEQIIADGVFRSWIIKLEGCKA